MQGPAAPTGSEITNAALSPRRRLIGSFRRGSEYVAGCLGRELGLTLAAIILGEKLGAKLVVLHGFDPGRIGVFAGPHNGQAAAIQFTRGMARLGYCKLWCGEWCARGALAPGAIYSAMDGMH